MYFITITLAVILGINSAFSAVSNDHESEVILRMNRGVKATIEDFPYTVSILGIHEKSRSHCGGAIISKNVVLTAAHCFDDHTNSSWYVVRAGSPLGQQGGSVRLVQKFVVHPEYKKKFNHLHYDVAVVQLQYSLEVNDGTIKPIAMFESNQKIQAGAKGSTAGWGRLTRFGQIPDQLHSLEMVAVGQKECAKVWGSYTLADKVFNWILGALGENTDFPLKGQVCVTASDNNKLGSTCNGDDGGPLVIDNKLAGISSLSKRCESKSLPNIFTEVAYHREWIDEQVSQFTEAEKPPKVETTTPKKEVETSTHKEEVVETSTPKQEVETSTHKEEVVEPSTPKKEVETSTHKEEVLETSTPKKEVETSTHKEEVVETSTQKESAGEEFYTTKDYVETYTQKQEEENDESGNE